MVVEHNPRYWSVCVLNKRAGVHWLSMDNLGRHLIHLDARAAMVFSTAESAQDSLDHMLARYPATVAGVVPAPCAAVNRMASGLSPYEVPNGAI